jgi:hypothetical protein
MAKAKTEKLSFSKFFPESTAYVSVSGKATASDNFNIDVKIGDGSESISLFTTDWYKDDSLATLKAIQEGITKAIEFQQKALKLPKQDKTLREHWAIWENTPAKIKPAKRVLKSTETVVKKKATPKKK